MTLATSRPVFWTEIRALILAAMVVFVYTISIGILNGTDAVDFDRRRILGHVHGGTLGWLTLSVFAASLWLFGEARAVSENDRKIARWLAIGGILTFPCYVAAFSLTYGNWRPIFGSISVIIIATFFAWVLLRAKGSELSVPHWGFLAALGTSIVGGVLGVLWGLQIATGDKYLPTNGEDAHPATMVVGFLVPVGLAMAEWAFSFPTPQKATRLGIIQMVFPFLGGIFLMLSVLLDVTALAPIAILLQIIGLGIFIKRMWPNFRELDLMAPTPGRYAAMATVGIIFVIGLAQYFVIKYEGDFDLVPDAPAAGAGPLAVHRADDQLHLRDAALGDDGPARQPPGPGHLRCRECRADRVRHRVAGRCHLPEADRHTDHGRGAAAGAGRVRVAPAREGRCRGVRRATVIVISR